MRIYIDKVGEFYHMLIEHKGDKLDFGKFKNLVNKNAVSKGGSLQKMRLAHGEAIFKELNGYWSTLKPAELDAMYDIYVTFFEEYQVLPTASEKSAMMQDLVEQLVDRFHPFDAVAEYMETQHIDYPDTVKDKFESQYNSKDRKTTYLTDEYFDLAVLAVVFRAIYPLWSWAVRTEESSEAKDQAYFEYELLRSLRHTELINHRATERLLEFVEAVCHKVKAHENLGSVVAGFGSVDIPYYLFARVILEKLATREVNAFADKGSLVSTIYTRIESESNTMGDKFQTLRERTNRGSKNADDDKIGYLETYSTRQQVSDDVHIANQVYLYDYRKVRRQLDDTIPSSLVKMCIDSFMQYPPTPIRPDHVAAVQWVLGNLVMPRSIPHIDREAMINAMAVTQAALIHWRFRGLAPLLSAVAVETDYMATIITTPLDTPSLELRQELMAIYPYYRHSKDTTDAKALCPGFNAVGEFAKMYADRKWDLQCTPELAAELKQEPGEFKPAKYLKSDLAELLIKLDRNR